MDTTTNLRQQLEIAEEIITLECHGSWSETFQCATRLAELVIHLNNLLSRGEALPIEWQRANAGK